MSKRAAPGSARDDTASRHAKRRKTDPPNKGVAKAEDVTSARQLQALLSFQQDAAPQLRTGIQSFKVFLESIIYPTDKEVLPRHRAILRDYLEAQSSGNATDNDVTSLPDVMQIWGFAAQTNNDHLLSAVVAVLALLLKTMSNQLDFREHGITLCRTILQPSQTKLLSRGLSAPKHKEFVISPCLRLLTEIVSFDGGAVARQVYSRRDFTFEPKVLSRNLSLRRLASDDSVGDWRKPSVRSNAVRYLLAHIKYQNEGAKTDILEQTIVLQALFNHIKDDPPALAVEILGIIKAHIILDENVSRSSKSHVLSERNLASIAGLYRVTQPPEEVPDNATSVDVVTHEFLLLVCTSSGSGTLLQSSGWYPPGADKEGNNAKLEDEDDPGIDLGLDSVEWFGKFSRRVPVKNATLAGFAQGLRPYASTLERQLLLAIFKAAPELVADYFFKKTNFLFDPKLTATWVGYSSFLFSTVQLPVPQYFGRKDGYGDIPPPISVVIENIMPQPLSQKVMTRCLNQSSDLIKFFATRIIIIAFQKLEVVLREFREAARGQSSLWEQASTRLVSEFCRRCPRMKDIIVAFRRIPGDNFMQREAITRLLAIYYAVTPQVALGENFDIAVALTNAFVRVENTRDITGEVREVRLLELGHLVQIARQSPNMRWWHKPESLRYHPFTTLLRLVASAPTDGSIKQVRDLLQSVVRENDILQLETRPSSLDALVASLGTAEGWSPNNIVLDFLDDCVARLVRRPIEYQDNLDKLIESSSEHAAGAKTNPVSLLLVALNWHWEHVAPKSQDTTSIAKWLARLLNFLQRVGEDMRVLATVRDNMKEKPSDKACGKLFRSAFHENQELATLLARVTEGLISRPTGEDREQGAAASSANCLNLSLDPGGPPQEKETHPGLNRWMQKDVEVAVEEGDVGELVLCLCSKYISIRRQALGSITKLLVKNENSSYTEWLQINLLLNELLETAQSLIDDHPLPYIAGIFVTHAIKVLIDPGHVLYPKLNRFLNRGPSWDVTRLLSYWTEQIILSPPHDDDAHHTELNWLLDYLIDALRTPADMEIFRTRNMFERVLALYCTPFASNALRERIVRLVWRATFVEGSTTLITRSGVMGWLQAQIAMKDRNAALLKRLLGRLYETCANDRVNEWSHGSIKAFVVMAACS